MNLRQRTIVTALVLIGIGSAFGIGATAGTALDRHVSVRSVAGVSVRALAQSHEPVPTSVIATK